MSSSIASSSRASSESLEEVAQQVQLVEAVDKADEPNLLLRTPPAYKAPRGYKQAVYKRDAASQFDLDEVMTDDVELWLVRAPSNIKLKHLEGLAIPEPGSSTSFKARKQHYSLADAKIRGDMDSMTAFLPRRAKENKLYKSKKPFARKLAVTVDDNGELAVDNIEEAPRSMQDQHKQPKFRYVYEAPGSKAAEVLEEQRPAKKRKK